ncbi:MAG: glycosyltransferase [Cyanobacteria bacterium]|nr:glycosyltransferase [Cyanobacteriota bacterium]
MRDALLLVNHVYIRTDRGRIEIDDQTWRDLLQYAHHFPAVTMAGPQWPMDQEQSISSTRWLAIDELPCADRVTVLPLPYAYGLGTFLRTYGKIRRRLGHLLEDHRYRLFTLGSLVGDWAAVAGLEAQRRRLPYGTQCDRVEHEVMRLAARNGSLKARIEAAIKVPLTERYHRHLLRHSAVTLCKGQETYQAYRPHGRATVCIYNTHTQKEDFIPEAALGQKITDALALKPIQVCYAGRVVDEKGPLDWVRALHWAIGRGANLQATWLGDGPLLSAMAALVDELGLGDRVQLPGFVGDRTHVLETLRRSHAIVFCHLVPESPRCLVESLVSGTALLGYGSPYPEGLVQGIGGGRFVKLGDWQALGELLLQLDRDRPAIAHLVRAAAQAGRQFDEDTLFRDRSELLKHHLG